MDGEKDTTVTSRRRFPFQGLSLFVLSFLLAACVGALIYLSLDNQLCQQQQVSETVDIEADVTVKSDNQEKEEKITYNQGSRVAYYKGADGSFEVDDFGKGIHIIRAPQNKVCYVIPVGADPSSDHGFENLLSNSNGGGQIKVNRSMEVDIEILPGEIEDISFIPEGAHKECTNGYQWMVVTKTDVEHREKRTAAEPDVPPCRYCYLYYVEDDGLYEACFTLSGGLFDVFCSHLYREGERPQWAQDLIDELG